MTSVVGCVSICGGQFVEGLSLGLVKFVLLTGSGVEYA